MKRLPKIKAVMTPFPYSIEDTASIEEAGEQMRHHHIRHLPVMRNGQLIGVVSDRDVAIYTEHAEIGAGSQQRVVSDICMSAVYVVDLKESLDNVLINMAKQQLDCTLVTKKGKLVGLFTVTDVCRSFAQHLRDQFRPGDGNNAA